MPNSTPALPASRPHRAPRPRGKCRREFDAEQRDAAVGSSRWLHGLPGAV